MLHFNRDGKTYYIDAQGRERPYRWWRRVCDHWRTLYVNRGWRRRQREFRRTGTRYYGGRGTIHRNTYLDVEVDEHGDVCAVWFRCQMLPFRMHKVDESRADSVRAKHDLGELHGVEMKDSPHVRRTA